MCRRFPGLLLLLSLIFGCGSSESSVPGLLDDFGVRADALYRRDDRLYHAFGDSIYSLDVSDPRRMRETDSDAWGDLVCPIACPGYFWQDDQVFIVGAGSQATEVAKVSLPSGTVPVWVFEPAGYGGLFTESSALISSELITIAQWHTGRGRLLTMRVDPSPTVVGSLDMTFPLITAAAHSSGFVFSSTNVGVELGAALVYDVREPSNPVVHALIDLDLPRVDTLAVRGQDLFASYDQGDGQTFQFNWYRLADDFRSVREIQRTTHIRASRFEYAKPVFYDNFLFVPGLEFGDDSEGVAVYGIDDTAAGLQLVSHTPKSSPGAIFVDNPRRVAYYGGGGIYAMDLDYVLGLSD